MDGFLNIDKPGGMTSYDVIRFIKRTFRPRCKIGHTGTLDPLAEGVLIVCLGAATKLSQRVMDCEKEYVAKMVLGTETDTLDTDGKVVRQRQVSATPEEVRAAVLSFQGELSQVPPAVSALKHKGQPLYRHYRRGTVITPQPRTVFVREIEVMQICLPAVEFRVVCSRGTYVRALCRDIGEKLGCGAVQAALRRTRVGPFSVANSVSLEQLRTDGLTPHLLSVQAVFSLLGET